MKWFGKKIDTVSNTVVVNIDSAELEAKVRDAVAAEFRRRDEEKKAQEEFVSALDYMRSQGVDVEGLLLEEDAYYVPGTQIFKVVRVTDSHTPESVRAKIMELYRAWRKIHNLTTPPPPF